ncbi:MAG: PorT family protein [Candidatus Cloacimonetes bacterium]|nr:PorT family protein [Candidatus Cloacimonadota bacterium]
MKQVKIMLIVLMLLTVSSVVFAQGITAKGVKVGLNLSTFTGDDADWEGVDKKMRIGFAIGGFITYEINEMFALQPELYYSMQGAKYKSSEGEDGTLIFKYNYIQVPILAKVNIPVEGSVAPNIFLGPAIGIKVSSKIWWEEEGEEEEEDAEDVKSTDFGLVFGAGVEFGKITVDARYNLGLSTIADEGDADDKNSVISLMVGYSF